MNQHLVLHFVLMTRHHMFAWYLELARINRHDQWTRQASHTIPDGVNYLPLQNYHTPSSTINTIEKKI